ncbi:hypothetical protein GCM10010182_00300 [Actinomadura cremea]|nr:hypothetical protein GCM10010182_00300 [Actinomadura cremea]
MDPVKLRTRVLILTARGRRVRGEVVRTALENYPWRRSSSENYGRSQLRSTSPSSLASAATIEVGTLRGSDRPVRPTA